MRQNRRDRGNLLRRTASGVGLRPGWGAKRAFSLIEALIALTITSMAGAVLLLGVQSSLDTTIEAVERTIADGIAQQTIDEIMTKRYTASGGNPLATTLRSRSKAPGAKRLEPATIAAISACKIFACGATTFRTGASA